MSDALKFLFEADGTLPGFAKDSAKALQAMDKELQAATRDLQKMGAAAKALSSFQGYALPGSPKAIAGIQQEGKARIQNERAVIAEARSSFRERMRYRQQERLAATQAHDKEQEAALKAAASEFREKARYRKAQESAAAKAQAAEHRAEEQKARAQQRASDRLERQLAKDQAKWARAEEKRIAEREKLQAKQLAQQMKAEEKAIKQQASKELAEAKRLTQEKEALAPESGGFGFPTGLATGAASAVAISAGTLYEFGKFAIEQTGWKRSILSQLALTEGGPEGAKSMYGFMQQMANRTPFEMQDVVPMAKQMRQFGWDKGTMEKVMLSITDAAGDSQENANLIWQEILMAKSQGGKLSKREVGVLARASGLAPEQIMKPGESMDFNAFMQHYADAVNKFKDQGKGLGTLTDILGLQSLNGQLSTLSDNFKSLFRDMNIDPVMGALQNLNTLLDSNSADARDFKNELSGIFDDTIGAFFQPYTGPNGLKTLSKDAHNLKPTLHDIADTMGDLVEDTKVIAKLLGPVVGGLAKATRFALHPVSAGDLMFRSMMPGTFGDAQDMSTEDIKNLGLEAPKRYHHFDLSLIGQQGFKDFVGTDAEWQAWLSQQVAPTAGETAAGVSIPTEHAPAHADGGLVMPGSHGGLAIVAPAAGERFASVGPGERILPAGASAGGLSVGDVHLHVSTGNVTDDADSIVGTLRREFPALLQDAVQQLALQAGAVGAGA